MAGTPIRGASGTWEQQRDALRALGARNASARNTFTRSAGDLLRDTPSGYQKITAPTVSNQSVTPTASPFQQPLPTGGADIEGEEDPFDIFNRLSIGLLESAKGVNTADLLKKRRLLERSSIDRSTTVTPEDERTLSPSQQSSIRGGRADALSSEIDANQYELEKAQQSIDNFYRVFDEAQKISADFAEKMVVPDSVIENAQKVIYADPSKLTTILAGFNDKSKQAILGSLDYSQMSEKEDPLDIEYKRAQIGALNRSNTGSSGGITPSQINTTVNSIAGAFDNEAIVKSYNVMNEGYQTVSTIGVNTKSPADDIAFIYAFAKIMDPNSVVREGEYNTIQKYAQTWAANFGFKAQRIFSNTNFLTSDAKQKMLNALKPKVDTITSQYNNLYKEYQRQVNDAYAGKPRQITNYAGGNNQYEDRINVVSPDGVQGDIPASQLQEALDNGYKQI